MELIEEHEKKYLIIILGASTLFSLWFYLLLTSQDRFALAHGYGWVSESKELLGTLGIALALILSIITYTREKQRWVQLVAIGLGLLLIRSVLHATHMINAMEANTSLLESLFEGENHFLLSISDSLGALLIGYGLIHHLREKEKAKRLLLGTATILVIITLAVVIKAGYDLMGILNSMTISHGLTALPIQIAFMPVLAFLPMTFFSYKLYKQRASHFHRLFFLGSGLLFLRTLVHGIHTVAGIETHFFQSGFDAFGGLLIASAFYQMKVNQERKRDMIIYALAASVLIMALVYAAFVYFRFR